MSDHMCDVSLVIACYNEESLLEESVRQTIEVLDSTCWSWEMIFVDDCSRDRTRAIIDELLAKYKGKKLRKLFHDHNKGRGGTVTDGIFMANGEVVGYLDIDLEVHAHYIPVMVRAIRKGADVATAHRIYKTQPRLLNRLILSVGYSFLVRRLLGIRLKDTETGFKFFRRERILPVLAQVEDQRWFWDTEIMTRAYLAGCRIVEQPCLFIRRYDKKSSVNVTRDTLDYLSKLWRFRRQVKQMQASTPETGVPMDAIVPSVASTSAARH